MSHKLQVHVTVHH